MFHPPVHSGTSPHRVITHTKIIIPGENRRDFFSIGVEHLMVTTKKTPDTKKAEPKKMEPKKTEPKKAEPKKTEVKNVVAKPTPKPATKPVLKPKK